MEHEPTSPIVIGRFDGTSILIDPLTGMEIATTESPRDPFDSFADPGERYALAVRLVEFAHARYPRHPMSEPCLAAAHALIRGDDDACGRLDELRVAYGNLAGTAGWLGVKVGDPSAATCMAAYQLARRDPDVLERAFQNLALMVYLAERGGNATVRREFERFVDLLIEQGSRLG
ncbi:MAG: hypothetical protein KIS66_03570 [Fimbriimonadaceae bacterium]|nr:hypothetical protein [Fimbriimonadaceae bacterium]